MTIDHLYYLTRRDKQIASTKRWQEKHQDALKRYRIQWKDKNKDRIKIYNAYYRLYGKKKEGMSVEDMEKAVKAFRLNKSL